MIFINNAKKKIGEKGLIINLKANNFYQGQGLRPEDFHKLYEIFTKYESKINLPSSEKQNFSLCVLYYESNYNNKAKKILEQNDVNYLLSQLTSNEEKLYTLFNIMEILIKIKKYTENDLQKIYNELQKIKCSEDNFEAYLLQKHYLAYLNYLLGKYDLTNKYTDDIVYDMDENAKNDSKESNLIKYLRIRNEVLKVKMLEKQDIDKNIKDIISHLDGLFNKAKNTKEDFAICIGIKMLSLQSKEAFTIEESKKLIEDMLNILKRETLFGKSHKNILEQYLYLNGLLGYYNSINSDFDSVMKTSKKIDKYLSDVDDIIKGNENKEENNQYNNLYLQYSYFNTILKSSVNNNYDDSNFQESTIKMKKIRGKIENKRDIDILNICILEKEDLTKSVQSQKIEDLFNQLTGENLKLENDKLCLIYYYLYNKISHLTKNIEEKIKIGKNPDKEKLEEIRDYSTKIIEKTKNLIEKYNNESLKKIFQLPFFKNLFNKFYYIKIYSYYVEGRYKECIDEYIDYDTKGKINFELETEKSNEYMKKIEADCYFKLGDFQKAKELYDKIVGTGSKDPLIYFNLGLSAYFNKERKRAINALKESVKYYKEKDKSDNSANAKKVEELIKKFEEEK